MFDSDAAFIIACKVKYALNFIVNYRKIIVHHGCILN